MTPQMPLSAEDLVDQYGVAAIKVDFHNFFYGLGEDGQYHPIPPTQIHFDEEGDNKVYTFHASGSVIMTPIGNAEPANVGDKLVVAPDGSHQIRRK